MRPVGQDAQCTPGRHDARSCEGDQQTGRQGLVTYCIRTRVIINSKRMIGQGYNNQGMCSHEYEKEDSADWRRNELWLDSDLIHYSVQQRDTQRQGSNEKCRSLWLKRSGTIKQRNARSRKMTGDGGKGKSLN